MNSAGAWRHPVWPTGVDLEIAELSDALRAYTKPDDGTTAWDRYARPPWEKWDSREGGSVMAFRTSFEQPFKDSHLVRFGVSTGH